MAPKAVTVPAAVSGLCFVIVRRDAIGLLVPAQQQRPSLIRLQLGLQQSSNQACMHVL